MINLRKFDLTYLNEMAELFADEYTDQSHVWDKKSAYNYLKRAFDNAPDYCFAAVSENACIGAVFCHKYSYYQGEILLVDSLQVISKFRSCGIGKKLLQKVLKKAKQQKIKFVHILADPKSDHPAKWYDKIGFKPTGWVEMEAKINDVLTSL